MNTKYLIISPDSLGKKMRLTSVRPVYQYDANGKRTDVIAGYKYEVVLEERGYERITIKIEGDKQIEASEDYPEVVFEGINLSLYNINGVTQLSATAKTVRVAKSEGKHNPFNSGRSEATA